MFKAIYPLLDSLGFGSKTLKIRSYYLFGKYRGFQDRTKQCKSYASEFKKELEDKDFKVKSVELGNGFVKYSCEDKIPLSVKNEIRSSAKISRKVLKVVEIPILI